MAEGLPTVEWKTRPREEAALFNPAFCGEIIAHTVSAYGRTGGGALNFSLAFVVLPLVLPPAIRNRLPGKSDTTFRTWAVTHEVILSDLSERVVNIKPMSREALLFMIQHQALSLEGSGIAVGSFPLSPSRKLEFTTVEVDDIRRAARLLGRWFANQNGARNILQALGLRP